VASLFSSDVGFTLYSLFSLVRSVVAWRGALSSLLRMFIFGTAWRISAKLGIWGVNQKLSSWFYFDPYRSICNQYVMPTIAALYSGGPVALNLGSEVGYSQIFVVFISFKHAGLLPYIRPRPVASMLHFIVDCSYHSALCSQSYWHRVE
jgi:hypothetical protein